MTGRAVGFEPRSAGSAADQLLPGQQRSRPDRAGPPRVGRAAAIFGAIALVFSALYFLSDVIEFIQGGFSAGQLWLTLAAEAAIPAFVVGIAISYRPRLGRLGELCAWAYAYSFVIFTGTVVYALVNHTQDYQTLNDRLGTVMTTHGAIMVLAGVGFGAAVLRGRLLPTWIGLSVLVGVVLVAIAQGLPDAAQLLAAGIRDLGFAAMGASLLRTRRTATATRPGRRANQVGPTRA